MKSSISNISNIIFDFDGVIVDSMNVRTDGFREIFKEYDNKLVDKLIEYHDLNGGLSRFNKIRYFYEEILNKEITDKKIESYCSLFTEIMKKKLTSKEILIMDTINFIKNNYNNINMHIASGSEEKELQFLCDKLEIKNYFRSIHGSPTSKDKLVNIIIEENNYIKKNTVLIGDSINDYEAAKINGIHFWGFNNEKLKEKSDIYISSYSIFNKQA